MSEMKGTYVNEENYKKVKSTLKTIATILFIITAVLFVVGIILIVGGANLEKTSMDDPDWFNKSSSGSGMIVGGMITVSIAVMTLFGAIALLVVAHQREISSFKVSSVAPVASDTISYVGDEIAPKAGKAIGEVARGLAGGIAGGISTGINEGKKALNTVNCKECGKPNKKTNKFCSSCGKELNPKTYCGNCGKEVEEDATFCPSCGTKIEK